MTSDDLKAWLRGFRLGMDDAVRTVVPRAALLVAVVLVVVLAGSFLGWWSA